MTPERPTTKIAFYRQRHRIVPVRRVSREPYILVCAVDGIRIHPNRGKGAPWRHDTFEIKEASQAAIVASVG